MLMFGWDFYLMLSRDSEDEMSSRFAFELVIWLQDVTLARWTQPSGPLCLWQCLLWQRPPSYRSGWSLQYWQFPSSAKEQLVSGRWRPRAEARKPWTILKGHQGCRKYWYLRRSFWRLRGGRGFTTSPPHTHADTRLVFFTKSHNIC